MSGKFGALACNKKRPRNWKLKHWIFSSSRKKKTDPIWAVFMGGMIDLEEATKLTKPSPLKPYPPHLHHVLTRCHSCQGWGTSGRHTPAKDIQKDKWKKFKSVQSIVQSPNQLVNTIESPVIFVQKKISWLVVSHAAMNPREASKTSPFAKLLVPPVLFFWLQIHAVKLAKHPITWLLCRLYDRQ